jgi:hypothetical protein
VLTDSGYARRRHARRDAQRRIDRALRVDDTAGQLTALAGALVGFISDRFDLPPGERTPQEVWTALAEHGLNSTWADQVAEFLENCDAARYAPGILSRLLPTDAAKRVRAWINEIERNS